MKVKNVFFVFVILFGVCNILYAQRQYETLEPILGYFTQTIINDKPVPPKVGRPGIFWDNEKNRSEKNDVYYKPDTITLFLDTSRLIRKERECVRYVMAYNKQGLTESILFQKLNKSKWKTTRKYLFDYDSRKNLVSLLKKYGKHRVQKQIQKYDARNNILIIEERAKGYWEKDTSTSFWTKLKQYLFWTTHIKDMYVYDSANQLVSEGRYFLNGNHLLKGSDYYSEYDLRGNLTAYRRNRFYTEGTKVFSRNDTSRFTYDNRNNLLTNRIKYAYEKYVTDSNEYCYDEKDNLIQRIETKERYKKKNLSTYVYDGQNNLTSVLIKSNSNEKKEYVNQYLHTYSYDNKNNLLNHSLDEWSESEERWENTDRDLFDYDERNNLIKDSRYGRDAFSSNVNTVIYYAYDEKNNLIEEIRTNRRCKYSYDQQGRILSVEIPLYMKYTFSYNEDGYGVSRISWVWSKEKWKWEEGYLESFDSYNRFLIYTRSNMYDEYPLFNTGLYDSVYWDNKNLIYFRTIRSVFEEIPLGDVYKMTISYKKIIL